MPFGHSVLAKIHLFANSDLIFKQCAMFAVTTAIQKPRHPFEFGVGAHFIMLIVSTDLRCFSIQFERFEVFSGFSNALFLIFIGVFEIMESFHRLVLPPEIHKSVPIAL